jgi:hypothetical protein
VAASDAIDSGDEAGCVVLATEPRKARRSDHMEEHGSLHTTHGTIHAIRLETFIPSFFH